MAILVSGAKYRMLELEVFDLQNKLNAQIAKWNNLAKQINAKGGEDFLTRGVIEPKPQFSKDEILTLLQLCHPDKHGGKDSALRITQKLLELR